MLTIANKLSFKDHIRMAEIERFYWDKSLISSPEVTLSWYNHNPETVVAVRDTKTGLLAGHLSLIPVDDEIYYKIRSGNYIDTEIHVNHIERYDHPGKYKLYCCALAIDPKHKGGIAFKMIAKEYLKKFNSLKEKGISFTDIISDNLTLEGEKFSKVFGMKLINLSSHGSKIMWCNGLTFRKRYIKYFKNKH